MDYSVNYPGTSPDVLAGNSRVYDAVPMPPAPSKEDASSDYLLGLLNYGAALYIDSRRPDGSVGGGRLRQRQPDSLNPVQGEQNRQGTADPQALAQSREGSPWSRCLLYALLAAVVAGILWKSWIAAVLGAVVAFVVCKFLNL